MSIPTDGNNYHFHLEEIPDPERSWAPHTPPHEYPKYTDARVAWSQLKEMFGEEAAEKWYIVRHIQPREVY